MSITIKDIARKAGVSHSTVSRALRDSPLITPQTTLRIKEIAAELGYLPSAAARSLKTNRSQALGVIISHIDDPYFSEILQGIEDVAQERGYSLFIAASHRDAQREQAIVKSMSEHRVDGVIVCSTSFGAAQSNQLAQYDIPIVTVNNQSAEDYRYAIYHDDVGGTRKITQYLIKLGHRRIGYLGNARAGRTTHDRVLGFKQAMEMAALHVPEAFIQQVNGGRPEDGAQGVEAFWGLPEQPTALVCFNDMIAIGVMHALQERNIQVPDAFSVTGFDNIVFSAFTQPPLTTFDQPKRDIGEEAARLLLDLLDGGLSSQQDRPKIRTLQGKLLVRHTTAPPQFNHGEPA